MKNPLAFSKPSEVERIAAFVKGIVSSAGANVVVLGLSEGIDSAVVCSLCVRALGSDRVLGVLMPSDSTPKIDMADARAFAADLRIRVKEVRVSGIVDTLIASTDVKGTKLAVANVQARARMMVLYFLANARALLVAGTGDRSEIEVGFFTKYGDGGVDLLPIGHLYKTQVKELGRYLGVPDSIMRKPSSPRLWPGHTARDEIPVDYSRLDLVLHYLLDERRPPKSAARRANVRMPSMERIMQMRGGTAHKRSLPPTVLG